jgi:predicted HicB family RNase H-like nuclease
MAEEARPTLGRMASRVLSMRVDEELLERLQARAATRGMSVQDYIVRTLVRDDFDERLKASVDETEQFYAGGYVRPSAGIR